MAGRRLLDLRSGGLILLLAAGLSAALVIAWLLPVLRSGGHHATGDGRDVESYGFSLDPLRVPRETLVASGVPRDGIPVLDAPAVMTASEVEAEQRESRRKYLVPSDRVLGVELNGAARAYPLRVLSWHEVANDTLGGIAIAVTFSPLCDATAVFERGNRSFGHSGLFSESNLLLYDRGAPVPSLWSQLRAEAVAGPAAARGETLRVVPSEVTTWQSWVRAHPRTTVLRPDPELKKRYRREPYGNYLDRAEPRFPVSGWPPPGPIRPFGRVSATRGPDGRWQVSEKADGVRTDITALWFAWWASHPEMVSPSATPSTRHRSGGPNSRANSSAAAWSTIARTSSPTSN